MAVLQSLKDRIEFLRVLAPKNLRRLGNARLGDLIEREAPRAKRRVDALAQRYPSAGPRELAQRLVDQKKSYAGMVGGVSGAFGLVSVPADLLVMSYLQLQLLTELATLYRVNLKAANARDELLDVFSHANGIGPMQRSGPKVLGRVASILLGRGGLDAAARAVPLVAAPISAYLNNHHIQQVADEAVRHYDGFAALHEKNKKESDTA